MACLFRSLTALLHSQQLAATDPEQRQHELRQRICNVMAGNPQVGEVRLSEYLDMSDEGPLEQYVSNMRQSHIWGGATEIIMFCELYRFRVRCKPAGARQNESTKEMVFESQHRSPLYTGTITWNGGHFEPSARISRPAPRLPAAVA